MQKKRAFTLIELLVVISIIALLIGILLPALGAARKNARIMQGSSQVRGIHTAFVLYAQSNKGYYVGLLSTGAQDTSMYETAQGRIAALVNKGFFTTEYSQSPDETPPALQIAALPQLQCNTSFALPQIATVGPGTGPAPNFGINLTGSRIYEYRQTENSDAAIVSDRLKSGSAAWSTNNANVITTDQNLSTYQSIHTSVNGDWRGSVGWNDNHVTYEPNGYITSSYGGQMPTTGPMNYIDDLFDGGNGQFSTTSCFRTFQGTTNNSQAGPLDDAYFIWRASTVP